MLQIIIIITSVLQIIIIITSVLQIIIIITRNCQSLDSSSFFSGLCSVKSPVQGCYSLSISLELTTSFFKKCKLSEKHNTLRQPSDEIRIFIVKLFFYNDYYDHLEHTSEYYGNLEHTTDYYDNL